MFRGGGGRRLVWMGGEGEKCLEVGVKIGYLGNWLQGVKFKVNYKYCEIFYKQLRY